MAVPRILAVDDEPALGEMLRFVLEQGGFQADFVEDANQAIKANITRRLTPVGIAIYRASRSTVHAVPATVIRATMALQTNRNGEYTPGSACGSSHNLTWSAPYNGSPKGSS